MTQTAADPTLAAAGPKAARRDAAPPPRAGGRAADALRAVSIEPGFARHAEGSVLIRMGGTEVLCAASVEPRVPGFLRGKGQGWVTAEYGMLPRATHRRGEREAAKGRQSGRTQEIQRLIGRALRAVVDRRQLGEMTVTLDCDVLNADGGTRCAAITGGYVALALALRRLVEGRVIAAVPLLGQVAAVSCGLVGGRALLDLDYAEDSGAQADANFVLTSGQEEAGGIVPAGPAGGMAAMPGGIVLAKPGGIIPAMPGGIVEVQAAAEGAPFTEAELAGLLRLARLGAAELFAAQRAALA